MSIPMLQSSRLLLRGHTLEDFDAYAAMWADPAVTRHIADGAPKSTEEAWTSFLRIAGHWQMLGYGSWAVVEKASGRVLGATGFGERRRDRGAALDGVPELGWTFASSAAGRGYATEAVNAVLTWGRAHLGTARVIAVIAPENIASIRVAQKCGFKEFQRALSAGRPRVFLDRVL